MHLTLSWLFRILLNVHLASPNFGMITDFSLQTLHLLHYHI